MGTFRLCCAKEKFRSPSDVRCNLPLRELDSESSELERRSLDMMSTRYGQVHAKSGEIRGSNWK